MNASAKLSKLALLSLIFGVSSFLVFVSIPLAIITGFAALYNIKRAAGRLSGKLVAVAGLVFGLIALVFAGYMFIGYEMHYRAFKVPTVSMSPAIKAKERIMVDMAAYVSRGPLRGDIIVYELLDKGKRRLMCKRVAGLPGEEVEIRSGRVYINGYFKEVPGLPVGSYYLNAGSFGHDGQPIKVSEDFYYVLGDNPSVSFDSRQHGPIDRKDIMGRYLFGYKGLPVVQIIKLFIKRTAG